MCVYIYIYIYVRTRIITYDMLYSCIYIYIYIHIHTYIHRYIIIPPLRHLGASDAYQGHALCTQFACLHAYMHSFIAPSPVTHVHKYAVNIALIQYARKRVECRICVDSCCHCNWVGTQTTESMNDNPSCSPAGRFYCLPCRLLLHANVVYYSLPKTSAMRPRRAQLRARSTKITRTG